MELNSAQVFHPYSSGNFPLLFQNALCPQNLFFFFPGYIKWFNNRQYCSGVLSFYSYKNVLKTCFVQTPLVLWLTSGAVL